MRLRRRAAAADLYAPHPATAPLVILFHQAGWSRGEYEEIAPKLKRFNTPASQRRVQISVDETPFAFHCFFTEPSCMYS